MDSTIVGVIIGSVLTLVGNFVSHWFTLRREEAQWLRVETAEDKKISREEEKAKRARDEAKHESEKLEALNHYQNSIQSLSSLVAAKDEKSKIILSDEKRVEVVEQAQKSLSALALRRPAFLKDRHFLRYLSDFTKEPERYANDLRSTIIYLASSDADLFPEASNEIEEPEGEKPGSRNVEIRIDDNFRKQQLIEGFELPQSYNFRCDIAKLTNSQRSKLADIYFAHNKKIPPYVVLYIPSHRPGSKELLFSETVWKANLNPIASAPEQIFNAWEIAYEKALEEAQTQMNQSQAAPAS